MFGKATLTFVCISKERAAKPAMLRCDPTSRPLVCEDAGSYFFTRSEDGTAYSGAMPDSLKSLIASTSDTPYRSRLLVNFRSAPPNQRTFEALETGYKFLLADGKDLLPPQFIFVKGTLCDRAATVLNTGICNLEARSPSLYWHIAVQIPAKKSTPISAEQYREELAFWLKRLEKMVVDPPTATTVAASSAATPSVNSEPEWVLVKTVVIARKQPNDPDYAVTTETFLSKRSVEAAGPYTRAAFRQSAKDTTGYEMTYVKNRVIWYHYDCKRQQIAGGEAIPDSARFMPYAQFITTRPGPFADANVVTLVCGSK